MQGSPAWSWRARRVRRMSGHRPRRGCTRRNAHGLSSARYQGNNAGDGQGHGQSGGAGKPPMVEPHGHQGRGENGLHWFSGLAKRTLRSRRGWFHGDLHRGTKDVAGTASFTAQALQLGDCFKPPQASIHAAWENSAALALAKTGASTVFQIGEEVSLPYTHTCQFFPCRRRAVINKASHACLFFPFGQRTVITKGKITHKGQIPAKWAALYESVHKCNFSPCGWRYVINKYRTSRLPAIGLEGHPRSVELGSRNHRTRLLAPVCSQATCILWRGADLRAGQRISCSLSRDTHNACKGCRANGPFNEQKRRWAQTDPRSQTFMRRPFRMLTTKQILAQIRPKD